MNNTYIVRGTTDLSSIPGTFSARGKKKKKEIGNKKVETR